MRSNMKSLDLFSCIGCHAIGFERAGIVVETTWGAKVPLKDALHAWDMMKQRKEGAVS